MQTQRTALTRAPRTNADSILTMLQRLNFPALLLDPDHDPVQEPFEAGLLDVGQGHRLYVEQCGNPEGLPVVFLHGGPGSACSPSHRSFFDPGIFRAILMDQRACGRSVAPPGCAHNTTAHLIADLEVLRQHLGLSRWLVMGGSWGAGLGLGYASSSYLPDQSPRDSPGAEFGLCCCPSSENQ